MAKSQELQKNNNLHKGHRNRMRKRYVNTGIASLEDHEKLEMLLFHIIPQKNTNPLAHVLLDKYGSLKDVFNSSVSDLITVNGIGEKTAIFLNFIGKLFYIYLQEESTEFVLRNYEERCLYFLNELKNKTKKETFLLACIDDTLHVRRCSGLETDKSNTMHLNIQALTSMVLESRCRNVILAHNHIGKIVLSSENMQNMRYIEDILKSLGINLIDYIIITDDKEAYSMKELKIYKANSLIAEKSLENSNHEKQEMLEKLLFYLIRKKNPSLLVHELLNKFGSLHEIFNATIQDLKSVNNMNENAATFLNFIGELFNICSREEYTGFALNTYEERFAYFLNELQNESKREVLLVACLDDSMCVQECTRLKTGDPNTVHFELQALTNVISKSNCKNIILAHNHPMGEALPSYEDIQNTQYIKNILKPLGINLIDHIIVANKNACSMTDLGNI